MKDAYMKALTPVSYRQLKLNQGFWSHEQAKHRRTTLRAVYDRFCETGRFAALDGKWKRGMPHQPHIFWESDITKWMEGVSYYLYHFPDVELEAILDHTIAQFQKLQKDDGYLNVYFTVVEPGARFTRRTDHELYCAGHMIEAAIADYEARGKRDLLDVCLKYIDYIDQVFRVDHSARFDTPGHQEIELALLRLHALTQDPKHLALAQYFLDRRGKSAIDTTYDFADMEHLQSHLPIREQRTAEGHSVRALYMLSSMADLSRATNDPELYQTCLTLYDNITTRRMSITGGVGATHRGESFTFDYDLPEYTTYNETCASIALAMFSHRLWALDPHSHYVDTTEIALYNTVLSGESLAGDAFFYENPLAIDPARIAFNQSRPSTYQEHLPLAERVAVFDCSCCPPNLLRTVGRISEYAYAVHRNTVYTHMYMDSSASFPVGSSTFTLDQSTNYPLDPVVDWTIRSSGHVDLAIRIPTWCSSFELSLNDSPITDAPDDHGYIHLERDWSVGDTVRLVLDMPIQFITAHPNAIDLAGRVAVKRGPIVYCAEAHDQDLPCSLRSVRIPLDPERAEPKLTTLSIGEHTVQAIKLQAQYPEPTEALYTPTPQPMSTTELTLIPYHAWANRGLAEMTTWFLRD